MLANLLGVAGVKHVITVDLHASQMQGFFKCPVDNLHAEPLIARWIRHNVPNWKEAVVVSKNAGGTKRVTSLADALKLNFGMVTTDRKRGSNMTASMIMNHLDGFERQPLLESPHRHSRAISDDMESLRLDNSVAQARVVSSRASGPQNSPRRGPVSSSAQSNSTPNRSPFVRPFSNNASQSSPIEETEEDKEPAPYRDERAREVTTGRLIQGHIVPDDFPSPSVSATDTSIPEDDPMTMSHASSFFQPDGHALGGSAEAPVSSDEEEETLKNPRIEHMITLVGDVKNRTVFIVDDMIDKPGSWIAAAETVVKRGFAKKVYCIATHAVFGGDCLEQLQACECIDQIVVTNSFPIPEDKARGSSKLIILDLSWLLAEAIRRNHHGESIAPLFQHISD